RRLAVISALAATAVILSACAGEPEPVKTSLGDPDPEATLTVGLVLEPSNLDIRHTSGAAIEQVLIDNIYEGLVTRTQDNTIEPRLDSDYDVSPDGLTCTFTLNEGIVFHAGAALASADVLASYDAVRTDETLQGSAEFAGVEEITAPDEASIRSEER